MKYKAIFVVFLILLGFLTVNAQKKKFSVALILAGDTEAVSDIRSYLSRELRSLGDVEINDNGGFGISVTIVKSKNKSGTIIGYALSVAFVKIIMCGDVAYGSLIGNWVEVGAPDELRSISETIITSFDTTVLEKYRKS